MSASSHGLAIASLALQVVAIAVSVVAIIVSVLLHCRRQKNSQPEGREASE